MTATTHSYEVRPRNDKRGVEVISDVLPFGKLWYAEPNAISNAINYAKLRSRSHMALIRVFDESGTAIRNTRARAPWGFSGAVTRGELRPARKIKLDAFSRGWQKRA
jgi:hypothetical protein